jgi:plastocyanin
MRDTIESRHKWLDSRANRRRAVQAFAAAAGSLLLLRAPRLDTTPLVLAQSGDNDDSGRGRGRGRGGDDDDDDHHNGGHSNGDDGDDAEQVAVTGQIPDGAVEVRIVNEDADGFVPNELTVDFGQTVAFVNAHDDEHTATGSGFDTGEIDRGQVATVVLDTPGVFRYACQFHPEMTGTINVRGADGIVPQAPAPAPQPTGDAVGVSIANLAFEPAQITVPTGSAVVWTNEDSVPHTVTAADGLFDSGIFDPGASFTWTFEQPGSYAYLCQLHPQMQGTIVVEGDAAAAASPTAAQSSESQPPPDQPSAPGEVSVAIVDFAFEPATIEVPAGTTVRWTNQGAAPHTVTGDFADSRAIDPAGVFSHTFAEAGTFDYVCAFHPDMTGQVIVGGAALAQTGEVEPADGGAGDPSGVWLLTVSVDNSDLLGSHEALMTFHPDGTAHADFIATGEGGAETASLTSGHGEWALPNDGLEIALVAFVGDEDRRFAGTATIAVQGQLDAAGTAFDGTFEFALFAEDGQPRGEGSGAASGQAVSLEP